MSFIFPGYVVGGIIQGWFPVGDVLRDMEGFHPSRS